MAALVLAVHLALIYSFGARKDRPVRMPARVPALHLADARDPFIALDDPTLFALPQANDFSAAVRLQTPTFPLPSFRWTEQPHWLEPAAGDLLTSFSRFMQTNPFAANSLDFKPPAAFSTPPLPPTFAPVQNSTLLRGDLAQRPLLAPLVLTNWPEANLIAASKIQVLVDTTGNVISAILLPADYGYETEARDEGADQMALQLARAARFVPRDQISIGQMVFNWHVVPLPVTATNPAVKLP